MYVFNHLYLWNSWKDSYEWNKQNLHLQNFMFIAEFPMNWSSTWIKILVSRRCPCQLCSLKAGWYFPTAFCSGENINKQMPRELCCLNLHSVFTGTDTQLFLYRCTVTKRFLPSELSPDFHSSLLVFHPI